MFGMGTGVAPPLLPPERLVIETVHVRSLVMRMSEATGIGDDIDGIKSSTY